MLTHEKLVYKVEQTQKKAALWKLDGKSQIQKLFLPTRVCYFRFSSSFCVI